ncbi:DNA-methyltransferase [Treponema phagedenis]|uniref:DNA-methyltransferase n=1 Tax=Treponema phagedenis TaxID=162 RepID=UPI0001F63FBB|nr:site-specific DNA-methyltransferase [Treponema phagedenis]EFW37153.1 DNA (cytosine-5-)-methyltransferase [Treponema phagedenis F0421]TYT76404.1 site-specific DNA-methyltransferase [Treponema phagedenis]TYT76582.1 site-specific DNA-methyltransferase [Treponema phagedenis]TYT76743.1 site-specific DNA-methyltransferase [Treponema phagedenis]TYT76822.1 site-specific DNA-methyltransferase [Treponema phagedenis]
MKLTENIELLHGDCLDFLPKIPDESIQSIITDPPYFLGMTHNSQKGCFNDLAICKPFYEKLFKEYKRILKPDGCIYFFCDWRSYAFYYPLLDSVMQVKNLLVWKKHGRPSLNVYGSGHELIMFSGKIKKSYITNIIDDVASFNIGARKTNGEKIHPTQKPIELMEKFIFDSTDEGDVVLDSFMGSGTTGIACLNTNRRFIGMEIDDNYFNIAKNRLETAIKGQSKKAV